MGREFAISSHQSGVVSDVDLLPAGGEGHLHGAKGSGGPADRPGGNAGVWNSFRAGPDGLPGTSGILCAPDRFPSKPGSRLRCNFFCHSKKFFIKL